MSSTASIAEVAALIGDPARAAMLQSLMDQRALTAGELARVAGIAPQTASGHLGQLTTAGLLHMRQQGRHRYFSIAAPQVARLLESLMLVASGTLRPRTGPRDEAMRAARTCYDHIAGRLGVAIAAASAAQGWIDLHEDAAVLTGSGLAAFRAIGIEVTGSGRTGMPGIAPLCGLCLDWSERKPHLSGRLGAAICNHALQAGWLRRRPAGRALEITPTGARAFRTIMHCVGI